MQSRQVPEVKGEAEYIEEALMFGHYDSRGGAMLMLGAASVVDGMERYRKEVFECEDGDCLDLGFDDLMDGSQGFIDIVVVGAPLPREGDVLFNYADNEGFAWFDVSKRCSFDGSEHKHAIKLAVLLHIDKETNDKLNDGSIDDFNVDTYLNDLVKGLIPDNDRGDSFELEYADVGEDAYGLAMV